MSVAITSVLTAGLASSLYIAAQSLDVADDELHQTRVAHRVLATLHRDAQSATAFSELTATSVTMSVPDRNGDSVPETIRYGWSGTAGDPLTYQYNSGSVQDVAIDVQAFSLSYLSRFIEGVSLLPRVLFVSGQSADADGGVDTPSAAELLRIDLIESWGYDVQTISQEASQATFDEQLDGANVVFVSGEINSGTLGSKVTAATVGVVSESAYNAIQLGILGSSLSTSYQSSDTIEVVDASHHITSQHSAGTLQVFDTPQQVKMLFGLSDLAPAANILAEVDQTLPYPTFVTVDGEEELANGDDAAGRRVLLPWGDNGFDFTALNTEGQTLLQRAIQWGAGEGADSPNQVIYRGFSEAKVPIDTTQVTLDITSGTAEGDLLIMAVAVDGDQTASLSAPAGWTTLSVAHSQSGVTLGVWWKEADAGEPSSHTITWTVNQRAYAWMMRLSNHDVSGPIHALATQEGQSSSPLCPAVTTTVPYAMVLRLGGFDRNNVTADDPGLSGHEPITMDASDFSNGRHQASGGAGYVSQAVAGDSGTANFTLTGGEEYFTVTIAIAPEPED